MAERPGKAPRAVAGRERPEAAPAKGVQPAKGETKVGKAGKGEARFVAMDRKRPARIATPAAKPLSVTLTVPSSLVAIAR